jgi:hypothetical protein
MMVRSLSYVSRSDALASSPKGKRLHVRPNKKGGATASRDDFISLNRTYYQIISWRLCMVSWKHPSTHKGNYTKLSFVLSSSCCFVIKFMPPSPCPDVHSRTSRSLTNSPGDVSEFQPELDSAESPSSSADC